MKPFFTRLRGVTSMHISRFILIFVSLLGGLSSRAQLTPTDCVQGCTSNDVQIISAYLSDTNGVKLPGSFVCPTSGSAHVFLTLELTTKTPRVGVTIYTNIRSFTPPNTIGSIVATFGQCFSKTLNQPTNKVTFSNAFNWSCGSAIVLTDVFIGWGTGNTDFCAGLSAFRCPATPSKCYQLPPGQYIPIAAPVATSATDTLCSTTAGGTTATFNLTTLETTIKGGQSNVTVSWFTDNPPTSAIATPAAYTTGSTTVYAKVTSTIDPTVYSIGTVTLVVNSLPVAPTASVVQPTCALATGTINVTAPVGTGITYSINGTTYQSSTSFAGLAPGNYTVTAKSNNCTSSGTSKTVNAAPSKPATPAICLVQPSLCGSSTGSVTITSPLGTGLQYSIDNGGTWQTSNIFSSVAAGSVTGIKVKNSAGCISDAADCSASSCTSAPQTISRTQMSTISISDEQTTVKAYPNPFNDKVKFVINSSLSGRGSLEIFNMMGQKVKTVYQGLISSGVNHFDLSLPNQKYSNLVYKFVMAGKQVSGRLIQISK